LVYWHWALTTAQQWRERLHLPRNKKWDDVIQRLSPLPIQGDKYLFTESGTDSYTNEEYSGRSSISIRRMGHVALHADDGFSKNEKYFQLDLEQLALERYLGLGLSHGSNDGNTFGMPDKAVDALIMPVQKNTYLNNGHNFQDDRLTIYLPGNGGLLAAAAMMCAGYEGSDAVNPGIPKTAGWKVRSEGLRKMF
jgi:hypothetical protein